MTRRLRWCWLLVLLCAGSGPAAASGYEPDPGSTEEGTYTFNGADYPYILYRPTSYEQGRAVPLVVVTHGCQTTAEQEVRVTGFNKLAEREGFAVLYPEADAVGRNQPGPLANCWKFTDPAAYFRGTGDPAALAGMTRQIMEGTTVDAERVYAIGVSAGGLMTAVLASAYSELYAAVGIVVSAGFADGPCFGNGVGVPVAASATLAFEQMRTRERIVPIIGIGSDADAAFPAPCTVKAVEQGLRTSNLAISGSQEGPISLAPSATREEQVPGGRAYTVAEFRDPDRCLIAERWIIHGMPHAWPGETDLPGYGDTRAPSGAEATWAFVKRYRKSDTMLPCAEAPAAAPQPAPLADAQGKRRLRVRFYGRRHKPGGVVVSVAALNGTVAGVTVELRRHRTLVARSRRIRAAEDPVRLVLRKPRGAKFPAGAYELVARRNGKAILRRGVRLRRTPPG